MKKWTRSWAHEAEQADVLRISEALSITEPPWCQSTCSDCTEEGYAVKNGTDSMTSF